MNSPKKINAAQTNEIWAEIIGQYAWFVRCDESRILRMEFGAPHLSVQGPQGGLQPGRKSNPALSRRVVIPTGQWSLFVEDGNWEISTDIGNCSRNGSDPSFIDACLNRLSGQRLDSAQVRTQDVVLTLEFDLSAKLTIQIARDYEENSQWIVFFEDGSNLSFIGPDDIEIEGPVASDL